MTSDETIKQGKTLAIICYFTFIGLLIAVIMNLEKKNPFTSFHIRQMFGLIVMLIVSNVTEKHVNSTLGTSFWVVTFVCWLFGLYHAFQGGYKEIPYVGSKFQEWFRNIK